MGSEPSAACGGSSEVSEWQRSTDAKALRRRRQMSGTATGERTERRLRRVKRGERGAAVDRCRGASPPKADVGHRKRKQVDIFYIRKSPNLSVEALCWHYLFSRLGQSIVLPLQVSGGHLQAEKASYFRRRLVFALPILTVRAIYRPAAASVRWTLAGRKIILLS